MNTPPSDESRLVATAELLIAPLIKADRRRKWQVVALAVVALVLAVVTGLTLVGFFRVQALATENQQILQQQKAGSVASCMSGNKARATNRAIWDAFISLLLNNPNAPVIKAKLEQVGRQQGLAPNEFKVLEALLDAEFTVSPQSKAIGKQFETFIAQNEQPQNCQALYDR